jgi:hypothetical protein
MRAGFQAKRKPAEAGFLSGSKAGAVCATRPLPSLDYMLLGSFLFAGLLLQLSSWQPSSCWLFSCRFLFGYALVAVF